MSEFLNVSGDDRPTLRVPDGGLKVGLLHNDLTQLMTDEDARLVRTKLAVRERSGPGLLMFALVGLAVGAMWGAIAADATTLLIGGLVGGLLLPLANYSATRMGLYDRRALQAAEKVIQKARQSH